MMGAGMGGMVADRNSLVNRLAALKESNPELFEEGVEVTPESLEASIAAALEGPVDVTPRIAAERFHWMFSSSIPEFVFVCNRALG